MTRYALYDIPIVEVAPTASGDDEVFTLDMAEDTAYKILAKANASLGENTIINIANVSPSSLKTILIYLINDSDIGDYQEYIWRVNGTNIPASAWRDSGVVSYLDHEDKALISVSNFGTTHNDMVISYIKFNLV